MPSTKEIYTERVTRFQLDGRNLMKSMGKISVQRLVVGLSACAALYLGFKSSSGYFILAGVLIAAFVYLINRHDSLKKKHVDNKILIDLNENELKNLAGENDSFDYDARNSYSSHIYANDLDVFGAFSLFRQINRTTTIAGKQIVIDNLLNPSGEATMINERKSLLSELSSDIDWRQKLYTIGIQSGEQPRDIVRLQIWNSQAAFLTNRKRWILIAAIASLMTFIAIACISLFGEAYVRWLSLVYLLNTVVYQVFFRAKANVYFSHFGNFNKLFSSWSDECASITNKSFVSALGIKLKESVSGAALAFKSIANLNKLVEYRLNGLLSFTMNGLFLVDIWSILQIENWRTKNGGRLDQWIDAIHQTDFLNSFGNYKFNHPTFCDPEIAVGQNQISATTMGHPLIQTDRLISNDFEIGISSNAQIITGSNMSGKSTFLRSIGLNMILALNGLPVCAKKFSCSNVSIATCIRINDSLEENQSYFRAEIKKLSQIMRALETGRPYLVLLDEILRGTNSVDKQAGTRLFYQKLANHNCVALLATHDPEIGNLAQEDPAHFQNFHFESYIVDAEIHFDYLLRPGVSTTKNATMLMKQLNLI